MSALVIVESPSKAKTIKQYLGKGYQVLATVGHIKNLPSSKLGVDLEHGFTQQYEIIKGKEKILTELKKAAKKASAIYIATDPDREGEAIAWHLEQEFGKKNGSIYRILFNEITKKSVQAGIDNPSHINVDLVQAQQARRVLDRIVGYQVSPFLWKTMYRGLSAGRVQSVALRLICEREDAVDAFTSKEYWTITGTFHVDKLTDFQANLYSIRGEKTDLSAEKETQEIVQQIQKQTYVIADVQQKETRRKPFAPFITSTLQQEGVKQLGMTTKRIMYIAQQLYEGIEIDHESIGLISYMRTDSTRTNDDSQTACREFIRDKYGKDYLPEKPRVFQNKNKSQDAHEAIRPTDMSLTPERLAKALTPDQNKLYRLIWNRFVASQMADAKIAQTTVDISGGEFLFRATGSVVIFPGFLSVFTEGKEDEEEDAKLSDIPAGLKKNMTARLEDIDPVQHFTKPPPRYTESSLVKILDKEGIGRPSTYALIISNILERKYLTRKQKTLIPTELGRKVNGILVSQFPNIFNVNFTAQMEEELDKVETGTKEFVTVMREFYDPFSETLQSVTARQDDIKEALQEKTDLTCEKCSRPMIIRWGRNGKFYACSGYPECKNTKPLEEEEPAATSEICEKCQSAMVVKTGRFGKFLACSNYPECKNTKSISIARCPKKDCRGSVVQRRSKRGKMFFGCSQYPKCDFVSWYAIKNESCPTCKGNYLEIRENKTLAAFDYCPACKSKYPEVSQN